MQSPLLSMYQRVDALRHTLGVDVCSLYQAHTESEILEIVATSGLNQSAVGTQLQYSQGLTGKVARTRSPVVARDIQSHSEYFHVDGSGEERFKSYLGVPLEQDNTLYAVLVIQTEETKTFFRQDIAELYSAAGDLMAVLLDMAGVSSIKQQAVV